MLRDILSNSFQPLKLDSRSYTQIFVFNDREIDKDIYVITDYTYLIKL